MNIIRYSLLTATLLAGITAYAQRTEVKRWEGEARIGFTLPMGHYHGGNAEVGAGLGLELRYNLPHSPWDYGALLNVTTAVWDFSKFFGNPEDDYSQSNRSANFILVGDYNFRQGKRCNPFVGLGVGWSSCEIVSGYFYGTEGTTGVLMPRAGIELFHHLRIGFSIHLNRHGYNNCELSIGGVLGGRPKKK